MVKVTPPLDTPTPTAAVHLLIPSLHTTPTLPPAPPLPTWTATPTPTPVVYIVQKGDNLLAIAYQYKVDVQAIIEANQIANPRALQVGQQLVIPMDEAALLAAQPTATPTPMPLRIVHLGFYRTPVGSMWCMGEVQNDQDEPLELVQIQAFLYNAKGERVDEASGFTATDFVPGPGKAPFALLFVHPPAGAISHEVLVLSAEPSAQSGRRHQELTVGDIHGEMDDDTVIVRGVLHNESEAQVTDIRVVATAYGPDDKVVGVRQANVEALDAGERQTISFSLIPAAPAVRVEAVAWGLKESP